MDDLIEEVSRLRGDLQHFVQPTGIPIEVFEDVGSNGIVEIHQHGVARDDSIFANKLATKIEFLPLEVVRAMCLAGAYILAGLAAHKDLQPYAINFLMLGSSELGFIRGMAFGAIDKDSRFGKFAANARYLNDPKQKDKAMVRECWDAWQQHPDNYKGKAAFARDMRDKFPNLESQPVIEGWCRAWERKT